MEEVDRRYGKDAAGVRIGSWANGGWTLGLGILGSCTPALIAKFVVRGVSDVKFLARVSQFAFVFRLVR